LVLGFESEKYITVKDPTKGSEMMIIDLEDNFSVYKKPNGA